MRSKSLHTVCEEAMCPNIGECWACGTATFLILGDVCTRGCTFCAVRSGKPRHAVPDRSEAKDLAEAVAAMGLHHVVITSVTRDDLDDGGAALFAECIRCVHDTVPGCNVEVLIPDFQGNRQALGNVVLARPEVLAHNVETVPRLYPRARPQADYRRSLELLRAAKHLDGEVVIKSGVMVGLGETWDELMEAMGDLREAGCEILTIGQYLSPTRTHLPVARYYTPSEFVALREEGCKRGFRWVESGPFVRSSYHADAQIQKVKKRGAND